MIKIRKEYILNSLMGLLLLLMLVSIPMMILSSESDGDMPTVSSGPCGMNVTNWEEKYDFNYDSIGYRQDYNNKTLYSISSKTASCLGIIGKTGLDTGENFLYVNPRTNRFDIISSVEIWALQDSGDLCLTADQAWDNIGKKRTCIGFRPTKAVRNSGFVFLNERHDYVNGFTATIMHDSMVSWDDIVGQYNGNAIVVSGSIEEYQNHPEIKVYDMSQIKTPAEPYAFSTKYGFIYKSSSSSIPKW